MTDSQQNGTSQAVKSKILAVARRSLAEQGEAGLSLPAVARLSGYDENDLYRYFQNKEALISALAAEFETTLSAELEKIPASLPLHDRLIAGCVTFIQLARKHPQSYRLTYAACGGKEEAPDVSLHRTRTVAPWVALEILFDEGIQSDYFKPHPGYGAREMAYACLSLVNGLAGMEIEQPSSDLDYDMLNVQTLETFLTGLQVRIEHEA